MVGAGGQVPRPQLGGERNRIRHATHQQQIIRRRLRTAEDRFRHELLRVDTEPSCDGIKRPALDDDLVGSICEPRVAASDAKLHPEIPWPRRRWVVGADRLRAVQLVALLWCVHAGSLSTSE